MTGVGTEIEKIIPTAFKREGCGCHAYAKTLNVLSKDAATVMAPSIVDRLVTEAKARWYLHWLGDRCLRWAATRIVRHAIKKADGKRDLSGAIRLEPGQTTLRGGGVTRPPRAFQETIKPERSLAVISIAVGKKASEIAEFTFPRMEAYAASVGADWVPITDDQSPSYPIGNKWRLHHLGAAYERTLFLDHDVWLAQDTPNLFLLSPGRIWVHYDATELEGFHFIDHDCAKILESQEVDCPFHLEVVNTGVVLFDRKHAEAWAKPKKPFEPTHTIEQTLFEIRARHLGFEFGRLPRRYNLQYWMKKRWGKESAIIYHLANCPHDERIQWLRSRLLSGEPSPVAQRPSQPIEEESRELRTSTR